MEGLGYGPNGGLIYCMEYLMESLDWFENHLAEFGSDDYLLLDCPGQIELYSHIPVMKRLVGLLQQEGWNVCGVYLLDAMFVSDASKLLAGNLAALSAMVHLEIPHANVLTKCDLAEKAVWERYLAPSGAGLVEELSRSTPSSFLGLNKAMAELVRVILSFVCVCRMTDRPSYEWPRRPSYCPMSVWARLAAGRL